MEALGRRIEALRSSADAAEAPIERRSNYNAGDFLANSSLSIFGCWPMVRACASMRPRRDCTAALRGQIAAHRQPLLALLRGGGAIPANTLSPIRPVETTNLTFVFAQERLWFLEQLAPGRLRFITLPGGSDHGRSESAEALAKSFDEI